MPSSPPPPPPSHVFVVVVADVVVVGPPRFVSFSTSRPSSFFHLFFPTRSWPHPLLSPAISPSPTRPPLSLSSGAERQREKGREREDGRSLVECRGQG